MKDVRCLEVYARLNVTETHFYFSIHLSTGEYYFFFKHLPPKLYMRKQHETKIERKNFLFHFYVGKIVFVHYTVLWRLSTNIVD